MGSWCALISKILYDLELISLGLFPLAAYDIFAKEREAPGYLRVWEDQLHSSLKDGLAK